MNIIDAKNALEAALSNIASIPAEKGFTVKYDCGYSNAEYDRLSENDAPECIFGEITIGVADTSETIAFECAVGVFEGGEALAVSDDELAQKIGEMREGVRSFVSDIEASGMDTLREAFVAIIDKEEKAAASDVTKEEPRSNMMFYIVAGLGALAVVAFFLCMRYFF